MAKLEVMITILFQFDNASPREFRVGGALRPLMCAALASLIMYYGGRRRTGEMSTVLARMREAWLKAFRVSGNGTGLGDAEDELLRWGTVIRADFAAANLFLTSRAAADGQERVVNAITQLGVEVARIGSVVQDQSDELVQLRGVHSATLSELSSVKAELSSVKAGLEGIERLLQELAGRDHGARGAERADEAPDERGSALLEHDDAATCRAPMFRTAAAQSDAQSTAAQPCGTLALSGAAAAPANVGTTAARAHTAAPPLALAAGPRASAFLVSQSGQVASPVENITGTTAPDFYLAYCQRGGSLPTLKKADKLRGQLAIDFFEKMAAPEERALMRRRDSSDGGGRRLLAARLNELVKAFLKREFDNAHLNMPGPLSKKGALLVGSFESRLKELKNKGGRSFVPDSVEFARFRALSVAAELAR